MILETIFGIWLAVVGGGDKSIDPASVIIKGIQTGKKVAEKTEKKEWTASLNEEAHQILKDAITEAGKK